MSGQGPRGGRGGGGGRGRGRGDGGGSVRGDSGGYGGGGARGDFRGGRGDSRGDRGRGGARGGKVPKPIIVFEDPTVPLAPANKSVQDVEDAAMKPEIATALAKLSVKPQFPPRPAYATKGNPITVYANYFAVDIKPKLDMTRYSVKVEPEAKGKKLQRIFALLLELPAFAGVVTDWSSMIISQRNLGVPNPHQELIVYRAEGQDEPLERAVTYKVTVMTPTSLSVGDLLRSLSNPSASFTQQGEVIQGLNVLLGSHARGGRHTVSIGANRHFAVHRQGNEHNFTELGGGLEAIRGFFLSVRPASGRLLVNVNVSHGVFLQPLPLDNLQLKMGLDDLVTLHKKLKKVRVSINHLPTKLDAAGNVIPRVKTIFGLANTTDGRQLAKPPRVARNGAGPQQVEFWLSSDNAAKESPLGKGKKTAVTKPAGSAAEGGHYITVWTYFGQKYPKIKLNNKFPVLNVGNKDNPSYLPAEVCTVLPGSTIKRRLDPKQTDMMIRFACRAPWENANSIVGDGRAMLGLGAQPNSLLSSHGVTVGKSLITVNARVLQAPQVIYGRDKKHVAFGSWNMADVKCHVGSNLGKCTYLIFGPRPDHTTAKGTCEEFKNFLAKSGVVSNWVDGPPGPFVTPGDAQRALRMISSSAKQAPPRFVICVLDRPDVGLYNMIKTTADTECGVHTVCVVAEKFYRRNLQYFGNISLKFNLKARGTNHTLDASKLGLISKGETMVVGIDVTHPSPGSKETAPSAAAIVASTDGTLAQWPGDFDFQAGRQEMVGALERLFLGRLTLWVTRNKKLPKNILIYRDGVSEGQYQTLLDEELPHIRAACRQKYSAAETKAGLPKISIIVCGKRHHTRFYPARQNEADRSSNCQPGTVVDRGVTEFRNWDFFLQSHACLQGTARTGHYFVVLDEIFKAEYMSGAANALEELTHNMCHLFGRATKAVSLCPPAYYADLLCTRLRCYLADQFDPSGDSATASVVSGQPGAAPQQTHPRIHPNLKDDMWYV